MDAKVGCLSAHRAFTLIELLTVIAIIGILAAILIPVAGSVRENARSAKCTSNLRQIGSAIFLHSNDNGGRILAPRNEGLDGQLRGYWQQVLWEGGYFGYGPDSRVTGENYEQNDSIIENVFHCPTTRNGDTKRLVTPGSHANHPYGYSYALNFLPNFVVGDGSPGSGERTSFPVEALSSPSQTMMGGETLSWRFTVAWYFNLFGLRPHNGGTNFLFYDGSMRWIPFEEVPAHEGPSRRAGVFWGGDVAIK